MTHNPQFNSSINAKKFCTQDSRGQLPQKKNQFLSKKLPGKSALFQHACDYGGNINTTDDVK